MYDVAGLIETRALRHRQRQTLQTSPPLPALAIPHVTPLCPYASACYEGYEVMGVADLSISL